MYRREARGAGRGRPAPKWRLAALAILLTLAAAPLAAQDQMMPAEALTPEQLRTATEAMSLLRSPVTPSHTVDMCPSVPALRDSIRVAAAAGFTRDQIVEDVIARHGEHIRLLPKRRGAGLWAWIATPFVLIVGAGLIVARLREGQQKAPPPMAAGPAVSEGEREKIAAAMREWEREGEVGE